MATGDSSGMAKLSSEDGGEVVFQFNPAAIVIAHTAPMQPSNARPQQREGQNATGGGGTTTTTTIVPTDVDQVAKANGTTTITMRAVTFTGQQVVSTCNTLLGWTNFAEADSSTQKQKLPKLTFLWGSQNYLVNLNQVTINYTRFSRTGTPIRAVVDLTLHSIPKIPGPTNPSSGGLSGRRTHMLTGAETLPELSTRTYGSPGRWREIAAANGIADPLRVRPGTLLYLPSEQEGRG